MLQANACLLRRLRQDLEKLLFYLYDGDHPDRRRSGVLCSTVDVQDQQMNVRNCHRQKVPGSTVD